MDIQLIIAFLALLLAIAYMGRSMLGKQLTGLMKSTTDSDDTESGCGPNCKCGK